MKVLFQGDSITDFHRDRNNPESMGDGYVRFTAPMIREKLPHIEWEFVNRAINGDRTCDLVSRWQEDCIDVNPDILSILVGINDTWRAFDANDPTSAMDFEANYRFLLKNAREKTKAKIIIMEPFLLHDTLEKDAWRTDLDCKIEIIRRLSREYAAAYIPLDGLFMGKSFEKHPSYWAYDGIHPSGEGALFIARQYTHTIAKLVT